MTISGSGDVGIGTSSPDAKLDVVTGSSGAVFRYDTASTFLQILPEDANGDVSLRFRANSGSAPDLLFKSDNGSEVVRIGNNGNVGIGTSSPSRALTVSGAVSPVIAIVDTGTSGTPSLFFGDSSADNVGKIQYANSTNSLSFVVNSSERMNIANSGRVGINVTSPSGLLHVQSASSGASVNSSGDEIIAENSANAGISILSGNSNQGQLIFGDDGDNNVGRLQYDHSDNSMQFITNANERMRIPSGGGLLVGKTSANIATAGFEISSGGDFSATKSGSTIAQFNRLTNDGDVVRIKKDGTTKHVFTTTALGVGNSSPGSPLTVSGDTNSTVANFNNNVSSTTDASNILLLQSNTSGSAGVGQGLSIAFNGERNDGNTQRFGNFTFSANTNSGASLKTDCIISLYSGHEVLRLKQNTVNGSDSEMIAPSLKTTGTTSNRYPLYWVHSGTVGSIQAYTGSVREMKTDINDMSSVDWIHSLRPRSFKFRDFETNEDGSKTYLETTNDEPNTEYGLIAEEVNEVNGSDYILDKQTDEDGNENLKGVLYHNLVPVLLKAVQEQKNTIQELEARITTLENA